MFQNYIYINIYIYIYIYIYMISKHFVDNIFKRS